MSCYFRHYQDLFAEAGIVVTPQNRKRVDAAIHKLMGTEPGLAGCPATGRELKLRVLNDDKARREFAARLKEAVAQTDR
jgi:hypothetical protein